MQPLDGITVLDFGQVYNGPYCGFLLAQAGARVIKVESLKGETLRARGSKTAASYPFAMLNTNKHSITLNIKAPAGQDLLKRMVPNVDVVFENFAPGTMAKHGIGAADLRKRNPRLVYASSTGYGSADGPYRDFLGMDITLQAMTGVMSITGNEDTGPLKTAAAFADFIAGTHLYAGIVSALLRREKTGEGATVDVSMQDCVFPTLATAMGSYYVAGEQRPPAGNRHPGKALAPYNVYPAADGHVAIICIREGHWRKVCDAMERPDLAEDPRFATMALRSENMDSLDQIVSGWTLSLPRKEIFARAQACGVICAPVQNLPEVADDPHMLARGSLRKRRHPQLGEISQAQTPLRFVDLEPPTLTDPPELGAANAQVYGELAGVDAEELTALREQGVV